MIIKFLSLFNFFQIYFFKTVIKNDTYYIAGGGSLPSILNYPQTRQLAGA